MVKLRPFFSFYGGKWRDAPRLYPSPQGDTIIEPFAGSAGYSVRHPHKRVILYDKDPTIAGLWEYLISAKESDILGIPDVPEGATVHDVGMSQEERWLAGFWLNKGVSSPRPAPSRWMIKQQKSRPETYWGAPVRERIAAQLKHIRHWQVMNRSYADCEAHTGTWFIDPPYQVAGTHYRFGSKDIDYEHLSGWCRSRDGLTIVCENHGSDWLPFSRLADVKTARRKTRSKEVAWISDSESEQLHLPLSASHH